MAETRDGKALPLRLHVHAGTMSIVRLPPDAAVPAWIRQGAWCSVTRTGEELSVVCASRLVPGDVRQSAGWRLLQVEGPLDFSLIGILHRITAPLAAAGISLFAISTFDTDYVLVGDTDLEAAIRCLEASGAIVSMPD